MGDLLAMSANLTKEMNRRMEKVAESGSSLLSAGLFAFYYLCFSFSHSGKDVVSDVSATITASRDKVTDVLSRLV